MAAASFDHNFSRNCSFRCFDRNCCCTTLSCSDHILGNSDRSPPNYNSGSGRTPGSFNHSFGLLSRRSSGCRITVNLPSRNLSCNLLPPCLFLDRPLRSVNLLPLDFARARVFQRQQLVLSLSPLSSPLPFWSVFQVLSARTSFLGRSAICGI